MGAKDWMKQEKKQAIEQVGKGEVTNPDAPRIVALDREEFKKHESKQQKSKRVSRNMRISAENLTKLEDLAHEQKRVSKKSVPDLLDEALELLFKKYES